MEGLFVLTCINIALTATLCLLLYLGELRQDYGRKRSKHRARRDRDQEPPPELEPEPEADAEPLTRETTPLLPLD